MIWHPYQELTPEEEKHYACYLGDLQNPSNCRD